MEDEQKIATLRNDLATRLGQQRFDLWFGSQARFLVEGALLKICVPSAFVRDCIRKNFQCELRACCQSVFHREMEIVHEVDGSVLLSAAQTCGAQEGDSSGQSDTPATIEFRGRPKEAKPNPQAPHRESKDSGLSVTNPMTFNTLVIGSGNQFAATSARMLAEGVHQASPILFWGPTGVGKTHLLRSIHAATRRKSRSVYLTAEQFTTGFIEAVRGSGLPSFRQKCRGANLLILDDIHFFVNKRATLEELLHTMDALASLGKQIVLTCDRPLGELQSMGAELVSRLSAGAICQLEPPDYSMRCELVTQLSGRMELEIKQDVIEAIAMQVTAGGRELQGALNRLKLTSEVLNQPIDLDMVNQSLSELLLHNVPRVRLNDIQKAVCDIFGVEASSLRSDAKVRSVSEPRMLAMWLARKYTQAPWSEIGQFFGRRSHSTVISAHRRVERLMNAQQTISVADKACQVEDAIRRVETALRRA